MGDIESCYRFRMTLDLPGQPTIERDMGPFELQDLLDTIRRASSRRGRPRTSREVRLGNMLHARDELSLHENVTQEALCEQMGYGSPRRIREWLQDLRLTWEQFLAL